MATNWECNWDSPTSAAGVPSPTPSMSVAVASASFQKRPCSSSEASAAEVASRSTPCSGCPTNSVAPEPALPPTEVVPDNAAAGGVSGAGAHGRPPPDQTLPWRTHPPWPPCPPRRPEWPQRGPGRRSRRRRSPWNWPMTRGGAASGGCACGREWPQAKLRPMATRGNDVTKQRKKEMYASHVSPRKEMTLRKVSPLDDTSASKSSSIIRVRPSSKETGRHTPNP